jgi:hypothetical protein
MRIRCACMPRGAKHRLAREPARRTKEQRSVRPSRARDDPKAVTAVREDRRQEAETTEIVLRIARARSAEFEAMFEAEEIPIWDDFTGRRRFLEARLIRVDGGSEVRQGIQDYILHIVAADHDAHEEHDRDPRFNAFLARAQQLQPTGPLVWFGQTIFERRA